ncbi:hypothetical protein ABE38_01580 [Brevibacillus agri]|nr:hypothetical protein [Brevibacillus agri]
MVAESLRCGDDDILEGDAIAHKQLLVWNDGDVGREDENAVCIGQSQDYDVRQAKASFGESQRVGQDLLGAGCGKRSYPGTCHDETSQQLDAWQDGNACRRTDRSRREVEALVAQQISKDSVKEVKGKRAAGRIAAWADVGDQLDSTDGEFERDTDADRNVRNQCVHGRLAIAVANWEDWRALWRERDRRATEGRRWRWYRNVVRTWRAEFGQHFQFDFRFDLDFHADNDIELNHAAEEDVSSWVALQGADAANDVVLVEWFRQAEYDLLIELDGCRELAEWGSVCEYTHDNGCAEHEADDTYANGGSIDGDVFTANADDIARRSGRHRLHARNRDFLPSANSCVHKRSTIVGKGNLVAVAVS